MREEPGIVVRRLIEKKPPEALMIAGELRKAAAHIRGLAPDLHRVKSNLDQSWNGRSRERFFEGYESKPTELEYLAEVILNHASAISEITVIDWESIVIPGLIWPK